MFPVELTFFTLNAYGRREIFTTEPGRRLLHNAIMKTFRRWPFGLFATCLLPDHWHLVMTLPVGDDDYSTRLHRIKREFTESWLGQGLPEAPTTASQKKRKERGIWQPRFWEHTVRDGNDLERCTDYIHWNPRKHSLVSRIQDWPWSSFHRFVNEGQYDANWGGTAPNCIKESLDWGESL